MKVPEQVARLGLVLGVLLAIVIPLRFFILPYSMFHYQPHQAAKVEREKLKPMHYAGTLTCTACHADEVNLKVASYHKTVACETCHGPSAEHASSPTGVGQTRYRPANGSFACLPRLRPVAAQRVPADRPGDPQPAQGVHELPQSARPEAPDDAEGVLGVPRRDRPHEGGLHHVLLECTACHEAPSSTRLHRGALPTKPRPASSAGSATARTRRKLRRTPRRSTWPTHGGKYVCWQCHYPHLPEVER